MQWTTCSSDCVILLDFCLIKIDVLIEKGTCNPSEVLKWIQKEERKRSLIPFAMSLFLKFIFDSVNL